MKINNETSRVIIENRPYSNFEDFYNKLIAKKVEVTLKTGKKQMKSLVSTTQAIMLIKAGAFDNIETNITREELLTRFLKKIYPDKKSISGKQIEKVIELGIIPQELKLETRFYGFRNYILENDFIQDEKVKGIKWYNIYEDYAIEFFNEHFINEMEEDRDYKYYEDGTILIAMGTKRKGSFESVYQTKISPLAKWLNSDECLSLFNEISFNDIKDKNMSGNINTWEMESVNYYANEHELKHVQFDKYNIHNFNDMEEEPTVVGYTKYSGKQYPKFKLTRICGTVLDRDKNKHIVTLLTPGGVVSVKFYQGQFAFYDKTLSEIDEDTGKKITIENSWFTRGNKLLVTGFRRGDQFRPKRYTNSVYQHSLSKILKVNDDGTLELQNERANLSKVGE